MKVFIIGILIGIVFTITTLFIIGSIVIDKEDEDVYSNNKNKRK